MTTLEQQARDLLERTGVPDAQTYTAGDLVELANVIRDANLYHMQKELQQEQLHAQRRTERSAMLERELYLDAMERDRLPVCLSCGKRKARCEGC